jgi:hypothetical protein
MDIFAQPENLCAPFRGAPRSARTHTANHGREPWLPDPEPVSGLAWVLLTFNS